MGLNDQAPFVGVVTFNPMVTFRFDLLRQTVRSIEKAFPKAYLFLVDNLSDDGSTEAVADLLGEPLPGASLVLKGERRGRWIMTNHPLGVNPENRTPGAGRVRLHRFMDAHERLLPGRTPFWAWSDDDMVWREGAEERLTKFWSQAPNDISILSGLLEPEWHWNTPRYTVEAGGERVLVRDSAPGAAWTFRGEMSCVKEESMWRFGYDYETCKLLGAAGLKVAQMDLAEHIGWGASTHGNEAIDAPDTKPLDREKWGL